MLRFYAYFKEGVHESASESERLRYCVIHYYLEDGTIMVGEPKVDNSGIPQGTLLKRSKFCVLVFAFFFPLLFDMRHGSHLFFAQSSSCRGH